MHLPLELAMAQLVLGMKLAQGDGITKNLPLAVQWLRRASIKVLLTPH